MKTLTKDFYAPYKPTDLWCIKEEGFDKELQNIRESQFALGNGYLGVRGVLEEKPKGARPGTFIAGIYDRLTSQVADLVNFPNPFFFKFILKGEKFGAVAMDTMSHQRLLNMHNGLLLRRTCYSDVKNRRYDYQSLRFVSMDNKNIGVMQVILTPLDSDVEIEVQTGMDTSVFNKGGIHEGDKKHFHEVKVVHENHTSYRLLETLEKKHKVVYRSGVYYQIGKKRIDVGDYILQLKLKKGQHVIFTRVFYINSYGYHKDTTHIEKESHREFSKVFHMKFETLLKRHTLAWRKLWDIADVAIEGTNDIQKNLRFNLYHMLICANKDNGFSSIGARTLSGEGYRGHIFWDAEIFLLPFYAYTFPDVARNMLLYRYRRLDMARAIAKQRGYEGAMFPWESAGTGEDETPPWAKDLDGTIIRIRTNEFEQHITADIAYACYYYAFVAGDPLFLEDYGYEMIMEAARFWASRVSKNKEGKYEILDIMGPDEFHEHVDNNAYTNMMAKWNLLTASRVYNELKDKNKKVFERIAAKIHLKEKEVKVWRTIAMRLKMNIRKDRVIEQFDGFFRKRFIEIVNFDENGIPLLPEGIKVKDYNKTQLVKQADVLMLLYLQSVQYNRRTKESNYWFYSKRTLHKSSLSPAIHCLVALEIGALPQAYQFFNVALRADISNIHGNTSEGIHAASLGGVWQSIVHGFAGIRNKDGHLSILPLLPKTWKKIRCSVIWQKKLLRFEVKNNEVRLKVDSKTKKKLKIEIFGRLQTITANKNYTFSRPKKQIEEQYYL